MQKGEPPSLSGMKVMGIRNCVSVRLNVTDLKWQNIDGGLILQLLQPPYNLQNYQNVCHTPFYAFSIEKSVLTVFLFTLNVSLEV